MTGWLMLADRLTDAWAGAMWRATWQGGLALAVVWAWCRLVAPRRTPAWVKCWLWRLASAKLLLSIVWLAPAGLPLLWGHRDAPALASTNRDAHLTGNRVASHGPSPTQATPDGPAITSQVVSLPVPTLQVTSPLAAPNWRLSRAIALCVWLVGLVIAILRLAAGWRATVRLRRRCTPVQDVELIALFADLASRHGLPRPPALMQADCIPSPLLLGVRRPMVVLPASLPSRCPTGELRLMLAHELAHLRRRDLLWNALPAAAQAVFWFHPLVWLARREWRLAQEVACDESAVAITGSRPAEYARALLGVVEQCAQTLARPRLVAVGVFENGRTLERRLVAMKHYQNWTTRRRLLAIGAITCVAAIGIPSWRLVARETPSQKEDAAADQNRAPEKAAPRGAGEDASARDRPDTRPAGAAKDAISAIGRITAPSIEIKALTGGMIRATRLEDGRRVKRGDLLVQLDDKLDAAQVAAAVADLKLKQALLNRTLELNKELVARGQSNPELDGARANVSIAEISVRYRQASQAQYRVDAPFDGVIANAKARAGQVISGGDPLATLVDLDHPAVEFSVTERDSTRIAPGARVTVTVPALERKFTGRVTTVAAQVNSESATVAVKATLDGAIEGLKPGMNALVAVEPGQPTTRDAGK